MARALGKYEDYGKGLFWQLLKDQWDPQASERSVDEAGVRADLDGAIRAQGAKDVVCAVEIEARIYKQIRGAIVDLALHSAPAKLLVVIPAQYQLRGREVTLRHVQYVWQQIAGEGHGRFHAVFLDGTGTEPDYEFSSIHPATLSIGASGDNGEVLVREYFTFGPRRGLSLNHNGASTFRHFDIARQSALGSEL